MDETATTSSASAAAVADSASGAANSKSSGAPTTAATSVKLLIKASNQQFDDQIIESDLLWTVKRLKTQLSLVYPSKPPVADQKLIYSGQLLNDTLLLKDVIRSYKDVYTHNHIFHLVCASKNMPPATNLTQKPKASATAANPSSISASSASTSSSLRYRAVAGSGQQQQQLPQPAEQQATTAQQQQQHQNAPNTNMFNSQFIPQMMAPNTTQCPNNPPYMMPFSFPGQFNMQSLANQQAAMYNWMQQVYSQYMDQCIRLSNSAAGGVPQVPTNPGMPSTSVPLSPQFPANPFLQQMPFMSNAMPAANFAAFAGPSSAAPATALNAGIPNPPVIHFSNPSPHQTDASAAAAPSAEAQPAAAEQPPVVGAAAGAGDQQVAQQPLRFPNIVQDEEDAHDWLDSFFSLTRLAIFLTILFFNTSPLRCSIVVIIAGGIYLYHIGVFRARGERNNNNLNRNNNAAEAFNQIRQIVQEVQQGQAQPPQPQEQAEGNPPNAEAAGEEASPNADQATNAADAAARSSTEAPVANAAENQVEDNQTTSVISFIRTFVVSFFTSLLPETPAI